MPHAQHCDSVIMKEDARRWELSAVPAQLTSDEITLSVTDGTRWIFDREPPEVSSIAIVNAYNYDKFLCEHM